MSISAKEKRIAVLIDAENIPATFAEPLFEEIAKRGKISFCRAFGDFNATRMQAWEKKFSDLGISSYQQDSVSNYKNSADIALVIGAMDLLHWKRAERFYLVTNDGDFTPLASRLKSSGFDVIGVGTAKASKAFQNACNDFVALEVKPKKTAPKSVSAGNKQRRRGVEPNKMTLAEVEGAIVREIQNCNSKDGWVHTGELGNRFKAQHPEIMYKDYGFATISKLLSSINEVVLTNGNKLVSLVKTPEVPIKPSAKMSFQQPLKAAPVILRVMKNIKTEDDWYRLAAIRSQLFNNEPEFNYRDYGCDKLGDLLEMTGLFEVDSSGTQDRVRRIPQAIKKATK